MNLDVTKLGKYFRYGLISRKINTQWKLQEIQQYTKVELEDILRKKFVEIAFRIQTISVRTKRKIYLGLSAWVDSLLIYHTFQELWIDFSALSLSYNQLYSEADALQEILWGKTEKISFIEGEMYSNIDTNDVKELLFPNTVSHPTILAYHEIVKRIPENSILVTGDLWDEIFGNTQKDLFEWEPLPEYVFTQSELWALFGGKIGGDESTLVLQENPSIAEVFVFFEQVTKNMWKNVSGGKNILYIPFYKYFLNYLLTIKYLWISTDNKIFLLNYASEISLPIKQFLTTGIKYPISDSFLSTLFSLIVKRKQIFQQFHLELDTDYLEWLLTQDHKVLKWKLFSLYLFTLYWEYDISRFCEHTDR